MNLKKKIAEYKEYLAKATQIAHEIREMICKALHPIIPDLRYTVGWDEAGIDTICFWSDSHGWTFKRPRIHLDDIIEEIFPELKYYIDTPFGVLLTPEEAEKARQLLAQLRDNGVDNFNYRINCNDETQD